MGKETNNKWVSTYLFYDQLDFIINKGISFFIDGLKKEKILLNFFFIRYYDKGSHIRLRLLVEDINYDYVIKSVNQFFSLFFIEYPSFRLINKPHFIDNNSIIFVDYVPETSRYGGNIGLRIAEKHFKYSSETVIELIKGDKWDISIAQGKALQLHYIFLKFLNIDKESIKNILYKLNNKYWREIASQKLNNNESNLETFLYKSFLKNKQKIELNIESLNSIIESNQIEDYPILSGFAKETVIIKDMLNKTLISKSLDDIYACYLHMLNNRLGLKNEDEIYLAYILLKTIDL